MSRWLSQQVQTKYPTLAVLEVLNTEFDQQVSTQSCQGWATTNSAQHPVLRDAPTTGAGAVLKMKQHDVIILNAQLRIHWRGISDGNEAAVLNALAQLP